VDWSGQVIKRKNNRKLVKKVSAVLSAGMLFQAGQCSLDEQALLTSLVNSVASVFVTDYVFDQFNVAQSPFGF